MVVARDYANKVRRNKRRAAALKRLKFKIAVLQEENRRLMTQRMIDLEIAAGVRSEKERPQRTVELMKPEISFEALEVMHATVLAILSRKNQPQKEATTDPKHPPEGKYVY
jgi:hypothetical protein